MEWTNCLSFETATDVLEPWSSCTVLYPPSYWLHAADGAATTWQHATLIFDQGCPPLASPLRDPRYANGCWAERAYCHSFLLAMCSACAVWFPLLVPCRREADRTHHTCLFTSVLIRLACTQMTAIFSRSPNMRDS